MTKVFLGGSRSVSRLDAQFRGRLDNIMQKTFPVVVGDANGADKAVQRYLHSKGYKDVEVFCSEGICRNNVGNWKTHGVAAGTRSRDVSFYSAKDRVMAEEATVGLMLWDGRSVGTLLNAFRLVRLQKKVVVYATPEQRFLEFKTTDDWDKFLASRNKELRHKIEQRTSFEQTSETRAFQKALFG